MSKVRVHISTSLDGYVAGPNESMENPLGEGGEGLHDWLVVLKSWREQAGMEGGEENVSDDVFAQVTANVGAEIRYNSPEEFHALIRAETAKWAKVIKAAGIRMDPL